MSQDFEATGWVWVDIEGPEQLDRNKIYRIEVGREYWMLRYGGLHEWVCTRKDGEPEVVANDLIRAGCPVYIRREPSKWLGVVRIVPEGDRLVLADIGRYEIPDELLNTPVNLGITELDAEPEVEEQDTSPEQAFWFRG